MYEAGIRAVVLEELGNIATEDGTVTDLKGK